MLLVQEENQQLQLHLVSVEVVKPSAARIPPHKLSLTPTLVHQIQVQLKLEFYISGMMDLALKMGLSAASMIHKMQQILA